MTVRLLLWLVLAILPAHAVAQDAPVLRMEVTETEAIPGQPLSLRLTVLVPTYMPRPPVWPAYEAPDLLVQLPEKSTTPVSERVNGQTWAGITRRYRISPMVPGRFVLPEADLVVTWADPETNEPRRTTLRTEAVTLTGVVPEGAEGLDPFVAANGLTLSQTIDGDPAAMVPGDSVTRTLTASIEGGSPMFLPPLAPRTNVPGLRVYPDEPVLELRDNRGVPSGTRTEKITFLAEGGGSGRVPEVRIDWYNVETGQIETARVAGFDVAIDGPPAEGGDTGGENLLRPLAVLVGGLLALGLILRLVLPPLRRHLAKVRASYLASEAHAWRNLNLMIAARDSSALYPALDIWLSRSGAARGIEDDPAVAAALLALGRGRHGPAGAGSGNDRVWHDLKQALRGQRRRLRRLARHETVGLPALN